MKEEITSLTPYDTLACVAAPALHLGQRFCLRLYARYCDTMTIIMQISQQIAD